jgi:acyl transferase domain-containing protein
MTADEGADDGSIAIVGMSARLPGAPDIWRFWDNLRTGQEAVRRLTRAELEAAGVGPDQFDDPDYVPCTAPLDGYSTFDAELFGFSPGDAAILDPQHRLFLEASFAALQGGGFAPLDPELLTGVFAGAGTPHYLLMAHADGTLRRIGRDAVITACDKDFLATRTAYKLGLDGPAVSVQTACSSSLVAVHLARQSLLLGECDLALAGGVSIRLPNHAGYRRVAGGIHAHDGRCRPYDAAASGTVHGSGVGVVVLRRLADAIESGDDVWAVIRGSAVTNDGRHRAGYTAPSVLGQYRAICTALEVAGVGPESVGYVEGHGTATALGDPIEVEALSKALGDRPDPCLLGSVKGNIGHLGPAAGIAGLIKVALSMRHHQLPPSINFTEPNPELLLASRPVRIASALSAWAPGAAGVLRAGVSSFGMGGTNAHVVLEEHRRAPSQPTGASQELLVLSAASAPALADARRRMADHLRTSDQPLGDIAATLRAGHSRLRFRSAVTARSAAEAADRFEAEAEAAGRQAADSDVVFVLPGQDAQRPGMLASLYSADAMARAAIDGFLAVTDHEAQAADVRGALLDPSFDPEVCARTEIAQPSVFIASVVCAARLMAAGLNPDHLVGHSVGEFAAAALAQVWSPEQALRAVLARGRAMASAPAGAMIAVRAREADVADLMARAGVEVAARNSPGMFAVSGSPESVAVAEELLDRARVAHCRMRTSRAFHHPMMACAEAELADMLAALPASRPTTSLISTVTGRPLDGQPVPVSHWLAQLVQPVEFASALRAIPGARRRVFVEIGPSRHLGVHVRAQAQPADAVLATASAAGITAESVQQVLAMAWSAGAEVRWPSRRRCVTLPDYPFQRRRYWLDGDMAADPAAPPGRATPPDRGADRVSPLAAVLAIWHELLGYADIDADDDFFSLGGHSLLGLTLCQRLREFSDAPEMNWLYRHPTPRTQAEALFPRDQADLPRDPSELPR